jgi:hypothetical protein
MLPIATDTAETMLGESYTKQLWKIPLAYNTVGRRISDILEDLCNQVTDLFKISLFAVQIHEVSDVVKGTGRKGSPSCYLDLYTSWTCTCLLKYESEATDCISRYHQICYLHRKQFI